jgi:ABC-type transporter Mla maintaining outer membrane lipid asymmetry permease subunit MlaE
VALLFSLFVGSIIATQLHQYFAPSTQPISSFGALIELSLPELFAPLAAAVLLGGVGGVLGERVMPTPRRS